MRSVSLLAGLVAALVAWACSSSKPYDEGNSPAGDYTYCGALTASCNASYAGTPTACTRAADEHCSAFQATRSQAFQDAVVSCAKQFSPCTLAFVKCIPAQTKDALPTTAQAKVKADFCAACPDQPGSESIGPCSTFFTANADAGPGIYGLGSRVLEVSDAIVAEIGLKCIGATFAEGGVVVAGDGGSDAEGSFGGCDPLAFAACADAVAQARTTPAACLPVADVVDTI